ncbi:MAG: DUF3108 domain-containing protein, partial [Betaproteobacteria bacterium]|nr:DUF3108 domain-containing protein [Betaproteobacteria bacterium]
TRRSLRLSRHALLWAILLSLLLHALLLGGFHLPNLRGNLLQPPPLEARLQLLPRPPAAAAPPTHPQPAHHAHAHQPSAPPPVIPWPNSSPATPAMPAAPNVSPAPAATPSPAAATSPTATATTASTRLTLLPSHYEIQFNLLLGENGPRLGRASYVWQADTNRYTLVSITEARGLLALFQPGRLEQISSGHIGPDGLVPDDFEIQRGSDRPDQVTHVHIDAGRLTATITHKGRQFSEPVPDHVQDILSVIFQLALRPPSGDDEQLHVTSGKAFNPYRVHLAGEEMLDTPLGKLRTLHLIHPAETGDEAMEIWLAEDYDNAPVKIRMTDSRFGAIVQIIAGMGEGPATH